MPVLSRMAASTWVAVRLSEGTDGKVNAIPKLVTPKESRLRWIRVTVLSMAFPAADESRGMNGAAAMARSALRIVGHCSALLRAAHDGFKAHCASAMSN